MKSNHVKLVECSEMRPVGRKPNAAYRVREHLTESEMGKLLAALRANRHGHRDWLIGLVIYRHGLRVSEACDMRWDDLDLPKRTIQLRRLKGSEKNGLVHRDVYWAMRARIMATMAGAEAEIEFFGNCAGGDSNDRDQIEE